MRKQIILIVQRLKLPLIACGIDYDLIRKAIAAGYFFNASKRDKDEGYRNISDN